MEITFGQRDRDALITQLGGLNEHSELRPTSAVLYVSTNPKQDSLGAARALHGRWTPSSKEVTSATAQSCEVTVQLCEPRGWRQIWASTFNEQFKDGPRSARLDFANGSARASVRI